MYSFPKNHVPRIDTLFAVPPERLRIDREGIAITAHQHGTGSPATPVRLLGMSPAALLLPPATHITDETTTLAGSLLLAALTNPADPKQVRVPSGESDSKADTKAKTVQTSPPQIQAAHPTQPAQASRHYIFGMRCADPLQYVFCGIPLGLETAVGRYCEPCESDIRHYSDGETGSFYNYGTAAEPEWFEYKALPQRLARKGEQEPLYSDRWGARRSLAAALINAELGMKFVPPTVYCLDPDGRLGIGERCLNFSEFGDVRKHFNRVVDLQDAEDCACFQALLDYPEGLARVNVEMDPVTRWVIRDDKDRLRVFSQRNYRTLRGYRGHFQYEPVVDRHGKGNGFTLATISPAMRAALLRLSEERLRAVVGHLLNDAVILVAALNLEALQKGIISLGIKSLKNETEVETRRASGKRKMGGCTIL